jgi:ubiquitin fusion degradation protein 1
MFTFGFGGMGGMGMPQSFDEEYHCFPGAFADKPELEDGDKILLPASALDTLTRLNIQYPMTFQITAPSGAKTHCRYSFLFL